MQVNRLLWPASVAVVGASPTNRWACHVLDNLHTLGFVGEVAAVNPRYTEVRGVPCRPSLHDLSFLPDAVFVAVGAERVPAVVKECAAAGVGGVVIIAGGFAEAGADGQRLQDEVAALANVADMAVLGPNCQGFLNLVQPAGLYMDYIAGHIRRGRVAVISQSGSVAGALLNNDRGVGFSHLFSCGNEAVLGVAELLDFCVDDPDTDTVLIFLEALRSPEDFFAACNRAAAAGMRIVALTTGRSPAAQRVAMSHSAALAAPARLLGARMVRHHVVQVDTLEDLLEVAVASAGRTPRGRGIAGVALSGGQLELMLDTGAQYGMLFPPFVPEIEQRLHGLLGVGATITNPLDAWMVGDFETGFRDCLQAVADDESVDVVVTAVEPSYVPSGDAELMEQSIRAVEHVHSATTKPIMVLATVHGSRPDPAIERRLADEGIPLLSGIATGLGALQRVLSATGTSDSRTPLVGEANEFAITLASLDLHPISGLPALELIGQTGIALVPTVIAATEADAVAAALDLGFPVAIKTADPRALHKTEHGAVRLSLHDERAVREAVTDINGPVLVQQQVAGGTEFILGLEHDDSLGTFVLVGLGGILTEIVDQVVVRPLPLGQGEADVMVSELGTASVLLAGTRGRPVLDRGALVDAIERLAMAGQVAGAQVASVDINPLIVLPHGAVAVDAVVVPRTPPNGDSR